MEIENALYDKQVLVYIVDARCLSSSVDVKSFFLQNVYIVDFLHSVLFYQVNKVFQFSHYVLHGIRVDQRFWAIKFV